MPGRGGAGTSAAAPTHSIKVPTIRTFPVFRNPLIDVLGMASYSLAKWLQYIDVYVKLML